jgi:hypothetical protein
MLSFELKLLRAEQHLERLEKEVKLRQQSSPYAFSYKVDPSTGENVIRLHIKDPVPDGWSLDVGDILHNMRSALDHLAFEIAARGKGSPLTVGEIRSSEFPIFREKPPDDRFLAKVRCWPTSARAIARQLQPYQRADPANDILQVVQALSNIDKHRRLHFVVANLVGYTITPSSDARIRNVRSGAGAFRDGDELARVLSDAICKLDIDCAIAECFDEPDAIPATSTVPFDQGLRHCLKEIRGKIFPAFMPFVS